MHKSPAHLTLSELGQRIASPTTPDVDRAGALDELGRRGVDVVDLGGPTGGRYWRVTSGHRPHHPDARNAAVHARVTGSVGATYNDVRVERYNPATQQEG